VAEKGLAGQPDHHVRILAERPQQGELLHAGERLTKDEDALRLKLVKPVHLSLLFRAGRIGAPSFCGSRTGARGHHVGGPREGKSRRKCLFGRLFQDLPRRDEIIFYLKPHTDIYMEFNSRQQGFSHPFCRKASRNPDPEAR
jgi:hypothetical protein